MSIQNHIYLKTTQIHFAVNFYFVIYFHFPLVLSIFLRS